MKNLYQEWKQKDMKYKMQGLLILENILNSGQRDRSIL